MMSIGLPVQYDGIVPFPASDAPPAAPAKRAIQLTVMTLIVLLPFAGLVAALWLLWGHGVGFAYLGLAAFFYLLTGFGVTVGFHRPIRADLAPHANARGSVGAGSHAGHRPRSGRRLRPRPGPEIALTLDGSDRNRGPGRRRADACLRARIERWA
jgi:hypothetical protein